MTARCAGCGQLFYDWALKGELCRLCSQTSSFYVKPLEHDGPFLLIRKGKRIYFYGRVNGKPALMSVEVPPQRELSVRVFIKEEQP